MTKDIVIIGAGLCGSRAALALRDRGFDGRVTLVGDEHGLPYDRPPLSKQVLTEATEPPLIASATAYAEAGITLMSDAAAARIDRSGHRVVLADGRSLAYDRLLLATGARPRLLPNTGHLQRLRTLRTHADAIAIREMVGPGRTLIVIGGGFIGLEVAAAARQRGASVILVEGLPRLMTRAVPREIASVIEERHREAGVEIIFDTTVSSISEDQDRIAVSLSDGRLLTGDIALAGIGAVPNIRLAEDCGLAIDNGIAVDDGVATSDPDIFAAGDCCSFPIALYDGRRVRLESWRSAQNQGVLAAANLLGERLPIRDLPWFWSDQYDLSLQIVGLADMAVHTVRREIGEGAFILFHLGAEGQIVAASGVGMGNAVAKDIRLAEMLILAKVRPSEQELASTSVRLKSLLAA
jgi:3-phenylpropionate/trans-cinnamate dioxygenase ferredoxin reductase subunit